MGLLPTESRSDATPLNRQRQLQTLLRDPRGRTEGSIDLMIAVWLEEFEPTPQLWERVERIRAEREDAPNWMPPPTFPEDVPDPLTVPEPVGPEQAPREHLDTAVAEMIELLEAKDFKTFVERYIQRQYRKNYNYEGNTEVDPTMAYDFDQQPDLVEMYIQNLRWTRQLEPLMVGDTAIFTHWFGRGPGEFHLHKVGRYWYFR